VADVQVEADRLQHDALGDEDLISHFLHLLRVGKMRRFSV
jgi:hypothetical protein